jgi:lipopolysaccharide transport system ATP-binding protein
MSDNVVVVDKLSKLYRIGLKEQRHETMAGALFDYIKKPIQNLRQVRNLTRFAENGNDSQDIIWALRDVSFSVKQGEVVGVIGRNGAGKSTLLKILSRITDPTFGKVVLKGRVSSLLEVGTGFHRELTGRENIYLNGSILGMKKHEIDRKFDEIIDFSGVEKFIDTPVKRYSSGMQVRLAFSVAAHLEPEILLIDEVLAVGDAEFQKKCLGKMEQVAVQGRTVLFVSHNLVAIANLCNRGIFLNEGKKITESSNIDEVIQRYISIISEKSVTNLKFREDRVGEKKIIITNIDLMDLNSHGITKVVSGSSIIIKISYQCTESNYHPKNVIFALSIWTLNGIFISDLSNYYSSSPFPALPKKGSVACLIERLPLLSNRYICNVTIREGNVIQDWIKEAFILDVVEGDFFGTGKIIKNQSVGILIDHQWIKANKFS